MLGTAGAVQYEYMPVDPDRSNNPLPGGSSIDWDAFDAAFAASLADLQHPHPHRHSDGESPVELELGVDRNVGADRESEPAWAVQNRLPEPFRNPEPKVEVLGEAGGEPGRGRLVYTLEFVRETPRGERWIVPDPVLFDGPATTVDDGGGGYDATPVKPGQRRLKTAVANGSHQFDDSNHERVSGEVRLVLTELVANEHDAGFRVDLMLRHPRAEAQLLEAMEGKGTERPHEGRLSVARYFFDRRVLEILEQQGLALPREALDYVSITRDARDGSWSAVIALPIRDGEDACRAARITCLVPTVSEARLFAFRGGVFADAGWARDL